MSELSEDVIRPLPATSQFCDYPCDPVCIDGQVRGETYWAYMCRDCWELEGTSIRTEMRLIRTDKNYAYYHITRRCR